jgi:hypothetical protein
MNQSYLGGGWYVEQMRQRLNESDALPFSLPKEKYMYANDYIFVEDVVDYRVPIGQAMDIVRSEARGTKLYYRDMAFDFLPQHKLALPVNKQNPIEEGISKPDARIVERALERLGCTDKAQAVIVGDSLSSDMLAAKNARVDGIWYNPQGMENPGDNEYIKAEIKELHELVRFVHKEDE